MRRCIWGIIQLLSLVPLHEDMLVQIWFLDIWIKKEIYYCIGYSIPTFECIAIFNMSSCRLVMYLWIEYKIWKMQFRKCNANFIEPTFQFFRLNSLFNSVEPTHHKTLLPKNRHSSKCIISTLAITISTFMITK